MLTTTMMMMMIDLRMCLQDDSEWFENCEKCKCIDGFSSCVPFCGHRGNLRQRECNLSVTGLPWLC